MKAPHIQTAIPLRRYEIDTFSVVVLGEVESRDPVDYRYIMAFVEAGESEPLLYITAEENPPGERQYGRYRVRVFLGRDVRDMGSDDFPGDLDRFTEFGFQVAGRLLQLAGEEPVRLL